MTAIWEHSLIHHFWKQFRIWRRFKYTVPRAERTSIEGVELNIAGLPPILKNNLMEGRYEVQERRLASRFLRAGDKVLELGAAIGFIGLYCQRNLGIQHYAGVEANPHTLSKAKANYRLNGVVPNLIHAAVGREDGTLTLNMHREFWCDSVVANEAGGAPTQVPAMTLRSVVASLGFEPTAIIADIEGAEEQLNWSELPGTVKTIIIELHPHINGPATTHRIISDLMHEGFAVVAEEGGTYAFARP